MQNIFKNINENTPVNLLKDYYNKCYGKNFRVKLRYIKKIINFQKSNNNYVLALQFQKIYDIIKKENNFQEKSFLKILSIKIMWTIRKINKLLYNFINQL
jgi:hypothetical protein